jgi:[ribosomal protein S5]-alanine N-acetyltransferase
MSEATPPVPEFETPRLRLCRLVLADAPGLHEAYGDAEAMRFWDAPPSRDLAETEQRIRHSVAVDPTWHAAWAVRMHVDGSFVGMVNYHARQPWNRRLVVGWIVAPRWQGLGLAAEAVRPMLAHCFTSLATHRIEAEIEPGNHRSTRLAERLGFVREGLLRERILVGDEFRSLSMYGLLRPQWDARSPD